MSTYSESTPMTNADAVIDVIVATKNPGKLAEIQQLLGEGFNIQSARDVGAEMPEETGKTFAENAVLKARSVAQQTGKIALADDSGLEVDALNGAPSVLTARYAGPEATDEDNRRKLLEAMEGKSLPERRARFVSVIAIAFSADEIETTEGTCDGSIALEDRGDNGFGYDSIFELPNGQTMAEISSSEKNRISHRGAAMRAASQLLAHRLGQGPVGSGR